MNKVAVVIASGPNDLKIPRLVFPTVDETRSYLIKQGLESEGPNSFSLEEESEEEGYYKPYFLDCYTGCGGPYRLTIREIEMGQPFIEWNLD